MGGGQRTVQVHATRRCNLSCAHCYSSSGPRETAALPAGLLEAALREAAGHGYEVVAFSGGEPVLYADLPRVLRAARDAGLRTTITTNGTLQHRLLPVLALVDLVAVSLDGPPERHNRLRGSRRAFDQVVQLLGRLREQDVPFGLIHTVTRENWHELSWMAAFAAEHGAGLLQVHPLELVGRARSEMSPEALDEESLARVYVMASVLAGIYADRLVIHLDALTTDEIMANPALVYAGDEAPTTCHADRLSVIVIEEDGTIVPVSYGFNREYRVGNLFTQGLTAAMRDFLGTRHAGFRSLCAATYERLRVPGLVCNWHERIVQESHARSSGRQRMEAGPLL